MSLYKNIYIYIIKQTRTKMNSQNPQNHKTQKQKKTKKTKTKQTKKTKKKQQILKPVLTGLVSMKIFQFYFDLDITFQV